MNRGSSDALLCASIYCMHKWLRGELRAEPPPLMEGMYALDYLSGHELRSEIQMESGLVNHYKQLLLTARPGVPDVGSYFASVASHRYHLSLMLDLWILSGPEAEGPLKAELTAELRARVRRHDLSKYGPRELYGYYLKFVRGDVLNPDEEALWGSALRHHYMVNDHHPEYHEMHASELTRLTVMPREALVEAVLDMMACRVERCLDHVTCAGICPEHLFSVPQQFLERFGAQREEVCVLLFDWATNLADMVVLEENCKSSTEELSPLREWQLEHDFVLRQRLPPTEALSAEEAQEEVHWRADWSDLLHRVLPYVQMETECRLQSDGEALSQRLEETGASSSSTTGDEPDQAAATTSKDCDPVMCFQEEADDDEEEEGLMRLASADY